MERSVFRVKKKRVLHQQWQYRQMIELEKTRQEFLREKKKFEEERRRFEREKNDFSRHARLEEERMKREKRLFEMKWKILEEELGKLANEKVQVKKQRDFYKYVSQQDSLDASRTHAERTPRGELFFVGVCDKMTLKKRYKQLLKIYHPDNLGGDTQTLQLINREYEKLLKYYEKEE